MKLETNSILLQESAGHDAKLAPNAEPMTRAVIRAAE